MCVCVNVNNYVTTGVWVGVREACNSSINICMLVLESMLVCLCTRVCLLVHACIYMYRQRAYRERESLSQRCRGCCSHGVVATGQL